MYGRNKFFDYLIYRIVMRNPKLRGVLQKIIYPVGLKNIDLLGQSFTIDAQSEIGYYRAALANKSNIFFRDEIPQLLTFISTLSPGMIFVDVGANVGTWTVQIASLGEMLGSLKVMSFEPNPKAFQRLKQNCARFANIELHNIALSEADNSLEFYETATSGVFSSQKSHFNEADKSRSMIIKVETLDKFLTGLSNIAIKIDVEGHELEVLRGAHRSLERGAIDVVFADGVADESYSEFRSILLDHDFLLYDARSRKREEEKSSYHATIAIRNKRNSN